MQDLQQSNPAYEKALNLLSIRMHTSFELVKKLKQKGFSPENISTAIEQLKQDRYLNDEQTAGLYLESLIKHKTFGYYGIKAKMMQKGINAVMAENLLSENLSIEQETKIAEKFLKNKDRGIKAAASLQRKGFRSQIVNRFLNANPEE